MWRGYYTSLRPGPNKIFVNFDIASQPMYQSGNLADVVLDFLRAATRGITLTDLAASKIPPRGYIELDRFLKGVKVQLKVRDKDGNEPVRKIKQFERSSAAASAFQLEDGTTQTVEVGSVPRKAAVCKLIPFSHRPTSSFSTASRSSAPTS